MVYAKHVGVYGFVIHQDKLLVIRKNRGPYTGKFDLPGGSLEHGEEIEDGLRREIFEEVGGEVASLGHLVNTSYVARWMDGEVPTETYHIGMYYLVGLKDISSLKTDPDGHDSDGSLWVEISSLTTENLSPIAYRALEVYRGRGIL